jgi:hypothetical protein
VGVFAEGGIVEDEVRAGLFDGAEIRVSFVNWEDPDGHGETRLRRGIVALIMAIGCAMVAKEQYATTPMVVWV